MIGWLRGCFGLLALGVLLLASAYAGWRWGEAVFPRLGRWTGVAAVADGESERADPDLARRTLERVDALRSGGVDGELALGEAEVESVVRYGAPGVLPEGVSGTEVEVRSGRLRLSARVAVDDVPRVPELERLLGVLPDTVPVSLDASLMPFGERGAALVVHRIHASGVPLPRAVIPSVLTALGRTDRPGLPPEAMTVPLPAGVRSAYIRADSLILVAAR